MKLLLLVLAIAAAVIGVVLCLFGITTIISLACADSAGACAFVSLFFGIPVSMVGVGTLIEFWERKD